MWLRVGVLSQMLPSHRDDIIVRLLLDIVMLSCVFEVHFGCLAFGPQNVLMKQPAKANPGAMTMAAVSVQRSNHATGTHAVKPWAVPQHKTLS